MAVGAALSPIPIAAVVTILLSARPANAPGFLLGWIAGIVGVGLLVFWIPGLETSRGEPTELSAWIRVILGGGLLVLALWKWSRRPPADAPVEVPRALAAMDAIGAARTVLMGIAFSALNPKNLVLTFAGVASIDASNGTPGQQGIALAVYAFVASLSVIVPMVGYFAFTERIRPTLIGWKDWLIRNNAGVVTVLLIVFGALLIGNGLKMLAG